MANISFKDMRLQIFEADRLAKQAGLNSPTSHVHGEYFHFIDGVITLAALSFPRASMGLMQRKAEIRKMVEDEYRIVL